MPIRIPQRSPEFFTKDKERYTILCPQMAPLHFDLMSGVFHQSGYHLVVLPSVNRETIEEGLRYVNNDVCYPAIVVTGQLIQALKSGLYDPKQTALLISQTCGGCRSTNYATFVKIAAQKAGFPNVPVIPFQVNINAADSDNAKGITLPLFSLQKLFLAFLYGDLLMMLSNQCRPYETVPHSVNRLTERWTAFLRSSIIGGNHHLRQTAASIVADYDALELRERHKPRVGIVGEILVKYHPDVNNDLVSVIEKEGGEAVVPNMLDFVLYCLTSDEYRKRFSDVPFLSGLKSRFAAWYIESQRGVVRDVLRQSKRFVPMSHIKHLADRAQTLVSLCNQSGEGWLLTGELVELTEEQTPNIICVQPFGCLPNHITGKGVVKELRRRYPAANVAVIDYDAGTTEVNQLNRIKLMMSVAARNKRKQTEINTA